MVAVRISKESGREDLQHTAGLLVAIREPSRGQWWTKVVARSRSIKPQDVTIGGWNAFVFDKPMKTTPGKTYVLTLYNFDYIGGGKTRLRDGLTGDHSWYVNTNNGVQTVYPNGGISPASEIDLAFKVYGTVAPLPKE